MSFFTDAESETVSVLESASSRLGVPRESVFSRARLRCNPDHAGSATVLVIRATLPSNLTPKKNKKCDRSAHVFSKIESLESFIAGQLRWQRRRLLTLLEPAVGVLEALIVDDHFAPPTSRANYFYPAIIQPALEEFRHPDHAHRFPSRNRERLKGRNCNRRGWIKAHTRLEQFLPDF